MIPIVLSSFGQGTIAIKHAEQGTGLGLTIVQALLHMHQGYFDLRSELRKGTEAIAYLPKERVISRDFGKGVDGHKTTRNPPALLNRVYGKSFFWDGRVKSLEQQVLQPIADGLDGRWDHHASIVLRHLGCVGGSIGEQRACQAYFESC